MKRLTLMVLLLAGCGGGPAATFVPVVTQVPAPTNPGPTIDVAAFVDEVCEGTGWDTCEELLATASKSNSILVVCNDDGSFSTLEMPHVLAEAEETCDTGGRGHAIRVLRFPSEGDDGYWATKRGTAVPTFAPIPFVADSLPIEYQGGPQPDYQPNTFKMKLAEGNYDWTWHTSGGFCGVTITVFDDIGRQLGPSSSGYESTGHASFYANHDGTYDLFVYVGCSWSVTIKAHR